MNSMNRYALPFVLFASFASTPVGLAAEPTRPNVVVIMADDLGYGDVGCYGGRAIPTPRLDRMAAEGLRMTRSYAPASTCTPTRYAVMTGEYPWRPRDRETSILDGDAPLAIEPGRPTLPQVLSDNGYRTELVGKWHLGIGDGQNAVDFNQHVGPGPLEVGFRSAFYIPATVDRVPCVFIDGHAVAGLDPSDPLRISYLRRVGGVAVGDTNTPPLKYPGDKQHSNAIVNGISRIGYMAGGEAAWWVDEDITDTLLAKSRKVIETDSDEPYFLMLGLHDPHVPHAPHPRFVGKSNAGIRGDSIVQLDWLVGAVLDAIDKSPGAENTLVLFTSDNGPTVFDGYDDGSVQANGDHTPAGPLRGSKYLVYEGGCRVPTLVRWRGRVTPGVSDAFFTLTDLLPSLATLAGVEALPEGVGQDAIDLADCLVDADAESTRESAILQGIGNRLAVVTRDWKYVPKNADGAPPTDIGRGADPLDKRFVDRKSYEDALFDLPSDESESSNAIESHPEVARRLRKLYEEARRASKP
ncbi:Arylsulfatase [Planctomycetes bacterium MalM25]|nr:Arylsulfatase [Planctomycetes bacterium MalM25]